MPKDDINFWQHCFPGLRKAFDIRHFHSKVVKIDVKFKFWLQVPLIWHQVHPLWCDLRHGGSNRGSLWPPESRLSSAVKNTEICVACLKMDRKWVKLDFKNYIFKLWFFFFKKNNNNTVNVFTYIIIKWWLIFETYEIYTSNPKWRIKNILTNALISKNRFLQLPDGQKNRHVLPEMILEKKTTSSFGIFEK